jgi:branched-subunit amino acid transport protein
VPTSYGPAAIAGVIAVVGLLTFAIRFSFVGLVGWIDGLPPRLERSLRFVPAAVLAALVAPSVLVVDPASGLAVDKLLAGGVATAVAWRTEGLLTTLVAGMVTLWAAGLVL